MSKMSGQGEFNLPKNNRRRLISTLYVIEERLEELKYMLMAEGDLVMKRIENRPMEKDYNNIMEAVSEIKKKIAELKKKYRLEARVDSYVQTANSYISSSIIDLNEILSIGMKGYGKFLDEMEAKEYDDDINRLTINLKEFPL